MSPLPTSRFAIAAALLATSLGSSAAGHPPRIESFESIQVPQPMASCGDFLIIVEGVASNRFTTFFDAAGSPVRATLHGLYNGTMTNSQTGKVLTDEPSVVNVTADLVAGTRTVAGAAWTVTVPGAGVVLIDAGRIVFDGNGPPVFIAGPHLPPPEQIAILCEALR